MWPSDAGETSPRRAAKPGGFFDGNVSSGQRISPLFFKRHPPVAIEVVSRFPLFQFVVDHIFKPLIRDGVPSHGGDRMRKLARC